MGDRGWDGTGQGEQSEGARAVRKRSGSVLKLREGGAVGGNLERVLPQKKEEEEASDGEEASGCMMCICGDRRGGGGRER